MKNYKTSLSIEKTGIAIGILITALLIIYFMLMKIVGLAEVLELRLFNIVFVATGVFYGINKHQRSLSSGSTDLYLDSWAQGMYIVAVSTILYALYMSIYISNFDISLLKQLQSTRGLGEYINGLTIFVTLVMEGFISGVIITFTAAQYFYGKTEPKNKIESTPFIRKEKSRIGSKV